MREIATLPLLLKQLGLPEVLPIVKTNFSQIIDTKSPLKIIKTYCY